MTSPVVRYKFIDVNQRAKYRKDQKAENGTNQKMVLPNATRPRAAMNNRAGIHRKTIGLFSAPSEDIFCRTWPIFGLHWIFHHCKFCKGAVEWSLQQKPKGNPTIWSRKSISLQLLVRLPKPPEVIRNINTKIRIRIPNVKDCFFDEIRVSTTITNEITGE